MNFTFPLYIFLEILQYIIFADVILSWLQLIGLNIRPKFLSDIIDPLYNFVKKILPTNIGPFDLTPIVLLISIMFLTGLLNIMFPGSLELYRSYI